MKYLSTLVAIAITTSGLAQSITAGVYNTDKKPEADGKLTILNGETRFFRTFDYSLITLGSKKKQPSLTTINEEQVIIVMEGELKVLYNKEKKILSRGGVAHIQPGDPYAFQNSGTTPAKFYLMKFASKTPGDAERGKTNGGSIAIRWEDVEKKTTDKGFSRIFYNHPTSMTSKFDMHATTLKEGIASHAPHTHAEEEIVLLLRGNGKMNIDGKFYNVAPGQVIFLSSEISHAIENSGDSECEYFAFQWK